MRKLIVILVAVGVLIAIANFPVTTRQGVDYVVSVKKIPLYIKIIQFIERDHYYRSLARQITLNTKSGRERALKLFVWTSRNIRRQPETLPVVDDHIMNIMIRGYGTPDQSADVFMTLCEYAGMSGCFLTLHSADKKEWIVASLIDIEGKKYFFDTHNGVYFCRADNNEPADIEYLEGPAGERICYAGPYSLKRDYSVYFAQLKSRLCECFSRAKRQRPFSRIMWELENLLRRR